MSSFHQSSMPNDFFLDSPVPPKLDLTGARSHFYRSPQSASAASSLCRTISSPPSNSRKRVRYGYDGLDAGSGKVDEQAIWDCQPHGSRISSPVPLANTEYILAEGGLDARHSMLSGKPSILGFSAPRDGENEESELDYRPTRYREPSRTIGTTMDLDTDCVFPYTPSPFERTKRKRGMSTVQREEDAAAAVEEVKSTPTYSWGKSVINLFGDVAGKVWDFCWSGPFRGFHAGGGVGYDIDTATSTVQPSEPKIDYTTQEKGHLGHQRQETPVPGQYPADDSYRADRMRRDDLHNSWVIVKEKGFAENCPSTGAKKIPRRGSVVHHVPARRSAARVQSKRPLTPLTPSRPASFTQQPPSPPSIFKTPPKYSTVSRPSESPLSLETQRHAAKLRRKEREEDASMRRLNHQLKAMIKEGKEALGTRIEIDEMDLGDWD